MMFVVKLSLLLSVAVNFVSAAASPALNLAPARSTPHGTSIAHYSHSTVKPVKHHSKKHGGKHHKSKSQHKRPKRRPGFPRNKTMTTTRRVSTKTTTKQTAEATVSQRTTSVAMTTTRPPSVPTTTTTTTTKKTTTRTTTVKTTTTTADPQPTGGLSTLAADSLKAHNDFRAQHGAKALVWDSQLQASAQAWADKCVFKHGGGTALGAGENLAATTDTKASAASLIKMWTDESKDYDPSNPQYSHFTQVVWKSTSRFGCAASVCNPLQSAGFNGLYYVCHYLAPGNVIGQFAENVQ